MANKFLGEAGVDQLINEMQQRYDKLDSFMVLDPSNKSRFMQSLLSFILAPAYCPIIFIKDVLATMTTVAGVGSAISIIKAPGTISPIIYSTDAARLQFQSDSISAICDNFAGANTGDVLTTLNYVAKSNPYNETIVLLHATKIGDVILDNPVNFVIRSITYNKINELETKLNEQIEYYGAETGEVIKDFHHELVKTGNVVQIDGTLFTITTMRESHDNTVVSLLQLIPLEISAAEVTEKFNS